MKKLFLIAGFLSTPYFLASIQAQTNRSYSAGGKMVVYFNTPVDNVVSSGVNAIYLNSCMADTLAAYINRAKYSIDIAQYDYSSSTTITPITTAINAAYSRGVKVRWIYDGSQTNTELANLNSGIHKLGSPVGGVYGIMHDKFMVIDGNSTNHNDPLVWGGSPDWSKTQFNSCHNNVIIIQDYALAQAYLAQFNQMWGGTGISPVTANEKFGLNKTSQGPHSFVIGGRTVELYFSPKDGTNSHILSSIASANTDLYFGVYTFTESTNATNIVNKKNAGIYVAGIVDQYSNGTSPTAYNTLNTGLGSKLITYANSSFVYHNKYLIVDPSNFCSDPQVVTGSHNWTVSADTKNDENTLIIHNDTIANIYYQAFHQNFTGLGGTLTTPANCVVSNPPVANFTASSMDCAGHAIILTDNSTNTPTSWNWTMTGGTPASSTLQNPSVTYSTAGTHTVTLISTNSSGASAPVSNTITVNASPAVPTITASLNTLTSSSTTGNQWYLNGTLISGAINQTYTATTNGSYTVVVTNSFGCSSTSSATNLTTTGIDSIIKSTAISIFPNPSNGIVTLNFSDQFKVSKIEVLNDLGELVYSAENSDCKKNCTQTIDMSSFKKGIYLFKIVANENIFTKKILLIQ